MKELLIKRLAELTLISEEKVSSLIEIPKDPSLGDYAFPCFTLAGQLKKNPAQIALELAGKISAPEFEKVEARGPYINCFVNRVHLAEQVILQIRKERDKFGSKKIKEKAVLEFPSPNTNKPLHIGHARNIVLGQAVTNILRFMGNKVYIVNLVNDRGVHICKSMLAYDRYGNGNTPQKAHVKPDHFVGDYYVRFAQEAAKNPLLEQEAQTYLQQWEAGDKKVRALWKKMNSWATEGFKETFKMFDLSFDKEYFESDIYQSGKDIILEGLKKKVFKKKPEGAIYADLSSAGLGEKILLRSDGTSIYITQDIYLAYLKQKEFKADKSIILSANEQIHHFKVLFKLLESLGNEWAKQLSHLNYGMVNLESGRMKSREGNVVDCDDLLEELQSLSREELNKRYSDLSGKEIKIRSESIARAAMRYYFLKVDRIKDVTFRPEESISFEGDTGPYLLYTYARAQSILEKAKYSSHSKLTIKSLTESEKQLVLALGRFPDVVSQAYSELAPNLLANYAYKLAQLFNEFYHAEKVIGSKEESCRLALIDAFSQVLKTSLSLLNIPVLQKM